MNTTPILTDSVVPGQAAAGNNAARPLDVVLVDEAPPYPARSPKQTQTLNLALRLAKRHRITLICPPSNDRNESLRAQLYLLSQGIRTVLVHGAAPPQSGIGLYARLAANLFSLQPWTEPNVRGRAFRQALRQHAAQNPVDLWQCESAFCAKALRKLPGIRWLAMAHQLESRLQKSRFDLETKLVQRWHLAKQLRRYLSMERCVFTSALTTVALHPDDGALVQYAFGAPNVDIIECGWASRQPDWDLVAGNLEQVWLRLAPSPAAESEVNGQFGRIRPMAQSA